MILELKYLAEPFLCFYWHINFLLVGHLFDVLLIYFSYKIKNKNSIQLYTVNYIKILWVISIRLKTRNMYLTTMKRLLNI